MISCWNRLVIGCQESGWCLLEPNHNARRKKLEVSDRKRQLDFIYRRDRATCQICGLFVRREDASRDHIKQLAECTKSEARDTRNQRLAHILCNELRHRHGIDDAALLRFENRDGYPRLAYKLGELFPELQNLFHEADE